MKKNEGDRLRFLKEYTDLEDLVNINLTMNYAQVRVFLSESSVNFCLEISSKILTKIIVQEILRYLL